MAQHPNKRRGVRPSEPCKLCGAIDGCSTGPDGLYMCRKVHQDTANFKHLGSAKGDPQFSLFRDRNDPQLYCNGGTPNGNGNGSQPQAEPTSAEPAINWAALAVQYHEALTDKLREHLADDLGLPLYALDAFPLLGWGRCERLKWGWTIPMEDGEGNVCGIHVRTMKGKKGCMWGGHNGLFVPVGWRDRSEVLYVVEGASDVMAMYAMGLSAIGRPSAFGGVPELGKLLSKEYPPRPGNGVHQPGQSGPTFPRYCQSSEPSPSAPGDSAAAGPARLVVVILGENDGEEPGPCPGRDGAVRVSADLTERLGLPIPWALPQRPAKDARDWFVSHSKELKGIDDFHALGGLFVESTPPIQPAKVATPTTGPILVTRSYDTIAPKVIRWLVRGYIPLGKLVLIAGDGGEGKSQLTVDLAAKLSRGECCFGLDYQPLAPCEVLLANCEDDPHDTTLARLLRAGADRSKVSNIEGVQEEGKPVSSFTLAYLGLIEKKLVERPAIRLIIIDPAGAYIGGTGADDNKDAELRQLLGPLSQLAARREVTILLVKHLNKGTTLKAVYKIAGSAGWANASRAAFLVWPDDEVEGQKLFLPLKFNCGPKPDGLKYRLQLLAEAERQPILTQLAGQLSADDLVEFGNQLCGIEWLGPTQKDADSLVSKAALPEAEICSEADRMATWMRSFLANGKQPQAICVAAGNQELGQKFPDKWWWQRVLKDRLHGMSKKYGYPGTWYWMLPGQDKAKAPSLEAPEDSEGSEDSEDSNILR